MPPVSAALRLSGKAKSQVVVRLFYSCFPQGNDCMQITVKLITRFGSFESKFSWKPKQ